MAIVLDAQKLTAQAFARFGFVVDYANGLSDRAKMTNGNTAIRLDHLGHLNQCQRPQGSPAELNICLFRSKSQGKQTDVGAVRVNISMLEKHPYSGQIFIPMHNSSSCLGSLIVVASSLPNGSINQADLCAFYARADQAVEYAPGIWHHPLISLSCRDFVCGVWENGVAEQDCITQAIIPCTIQISSQLLP